MRWRWWRDKAYECMLCGWQGMCEPEPPFGDAPCPECGDRMLPRPWLDTWGRALLILSVVAATVLFVAYFGHA